MFSHELGHYRPSGLEFRVVSVVPEELNDSGLHMVATGMQRVIHSALVGRFQGIYTEQQVAIDANPEDESLVEAQTRRILAGSGDVGWFLLALAENADTVADSLPIVGVAKTKDQPAGPRQLLTLADIGNIYTDPLAQEQGVATALLHGMLQGHPRDRRTTAYDYSHKTGAEIRMLADFKVKKSWDVDAFGQRVLQDWHVGPRVGTLEQSLEKRHPWLIEAE